MSNLHDDAERLNLAMGAFGLAFTRALRIPQLLLLMARGLDWLTRRIRGW